MKRLLFVMIALVSYWLHAETIRRKTRKLVKIISKTINVGTGVCPFSFHKHKDGKLTGYDIDVIKAVAKEEGLKLKFNETS